MKAELLQELLKLKETLYKRYIPSNYSLYNFYATNKHKTILSGDKQQSVSFESVDSRFNILEIKTILMKG